MTDVQEELRVEAKTHSEFGRKYFVVSWGKLRYLIAAPQIWTLERCCASVGAKRSNEWFECLCGDALATDRVLRVSDPHLRQKLELHLATTMNFLASELESFGLHTALMAFLDNGSQEDPTPW